MTDIKFEILGILYSESDRCMGKIKLNNSFAPGKVMPAKYAIDELIKCKYLEQDPSLESVYLTHLGANAYESEKEERYNNAQQKRQQSFDNKVSVANVLIPLITFFLGIIVEHCTQIIDSIITFFE